jgi:hypothetical protein
MNAASMLVGFGLVGLFVLPADAQKRQADRRVPVDVSVAGGGVGPSIAPFQVGSACIQRILDQANGACLEASSEPTFGKLFPYPGTSNTFGGTAFVGGGKNNTASASGATVGGGTSNFASGFDATVGGGHTNTASANHTTVGGGSGNSASEFATTVGGGGENSATKFGATVGGGHSNTASGPQATVGGGLHNTASGYRATVGGGLYNTAYGGQATVAGGSYCTANGLFATVAGGRANAAPGFYAAVGGGGFHTASGFAGTIPGGFDNTAQGDHSFAAGRSAMANHNGSFVWGDSQPNFTIKTSSIADEFNVYASGGARFFSNSAATTGVRLAPGGGSWTAVSSRDMKENVELVDVQAILEQVVEIPISTWNYKEQSNSIRHMGPMAQDFYAAFGLGLGETTIDTIDPDGVALAAIQGVNAKLEQRLAENDAEIAELRERLERLEARDSR